MSGNAGMPRWTARCWRCRAVPIWAILSSVPARADLEALDLAGPALAFGLGDAVAQVVPDFLEPALLGGVRPQERASDAPLTELTTMFQQFMAGFRLSALTCPRDRIG
jgi:hypothetical protein